MCLCVVLILPKKTPVNQTSVKRLPVQHSADYIFISFWITGPIVVALKIEFCVCIRYVQGVSCVAIFITAYEESQ